MNGPGRRWLVWLAIAVLAVPSALALNTAYRYGMADVTGMRARAMLDRWQGDPALVPSHDALDLVRDELFLALRHVPDDPVALEGVAMTYALLVDRAAGLPALRALLLDEVVMLKRQALAQRPMSPYTWANLALALHLLDSEPEAMWDAYDRAYRYGAREVSVQVRLLEIALARWDSLPLARREAAQAWLAATGDGRAGRVLKRRFAGTPLMAAAER